MAKNEHHTASISPALDEVLEEHGLKLGSDKYLRWHLHSHHHPRNWHWVRKCYDVGLIMFLEMTMLVSILPQSTSWPFTRELI